MSTTIESTELEVVIEGKVLKSNLDAFCVQLKEVVKSLNRELSTDADFESAGEHAKFLKSAENSLKSAKDEALKQAKDIQNLFAAIDDVSEEARQARLGLERQIKTRKEERRVEIINMGLAGIHEDLGKSYLSTIEDSVKGKRSFESMQCAVDRTVSKINEMLDANRLELTNFLQVNDKSLIPDESNLLQMTPLALQSELKHRVERAEAEAEKKRLEAEIAAQKAEAEAKAKAEAEAELESRKRPRPEPMGVEVPEVAKPEPKEVEVLDVEKTKKPFSVIEFEGFLEIIRSAMLTVKEARSELENPINIVKANAFAVAVNEAWRKLTGGAS